MIEGFSGAAVGGILWDDDADDKEEVDDDIDDEENTSLEWVKSESERERREWSH